MHFNSATHTVLRVDGDVRRRTRHTQAERGGERCCNLSSDSRERPRPAHDGGDGEVSAGGMAHVDAEVGPKVVGDACGRIQDANRVRAVCTMHL